MAYKIYSSVNLKFFLGPLSFQFSTLSTRTVVNLGGGGEHAKKQKKTSRYTKIVELARLFSVLLG